MARVIRSNLVGGSVQGARSTAHAVAIIAIDGAAVIMIHVPQQRIKPQRWSAHCHSFL